MKKVNPTPSPSSSSPCDPASLGLFIKAARTQQGLTIEQAAALGGVSLGTFVAAENKTATLKLATVFKILNSLGVQLRAQLQNTPTGGNDGWF
ncbi:helix-turn-helix domain-containing protein [Limnobacter sp.]|jgi:transcriptional regulator with XRE-family HTH domain|uniref:helix-turn-helix domain-containing protein n=1 Tax=Limnobacter sp. TaxID=2003368 RepID=UPI003748D00E